MRRFDREIIDPVIINAMMKEFDTLYLGLIDGDYPYVVPVNFGYMMKDDQLLLYIHTSKQGHKIDLIHKSQNVSVTFSQFNDFPDKKYKMHYHDYRSVMAKGHIHLIEPDKDFNKYKQAFELLYTCNHREVKPLDKEHLPPMNIYEIVCDMKDVTAKSEFPLRTVEDVPFMDIYSQEDDQTPFDITDIIEDRKKRMK